MELQRRGKLIYVSMADLSLTNGPGVNEREFAIELRRRFGSSTELLIPRPRFDLSDVRRLDARYYHNPGHWSIRGIWRQQRDLRLQLNRLMDSGSVAAVICRLSLLPLAVAHLGHAHVPLFVKTLGEVNGFARCRGAKRIVARLLVPLNDRLHRRILGRAAGVDCCTEILRRRLIARFGVPAERTCLVENATNVERFAPADPNESKRRVGLERFPRLLGYVGGSAGDRGGMQILETLARLRRDHPTLGAAIVGHDHDGRLARHARLLRVDDRVALPGQVPYEQVVHYVNSFDVAFALDDAARLRQVGNSYQKVRQYLACGRPVVTNIDDPDSPLVRLGLVVTVRGDDAEDVERAAREVLDWSDVRREDHRRRARDHACRHLSTRATMEQRLEFWRSRLFEPRKDAAA